MPAINQRRLGPPCGWIQGKGRRAKGKSKRAKVKGQRAKGKGQREKGSTAPSPTFTLVPFTFALLPFYFYLSWPILCLRHDMRVRLFNAVNDMNLGDHQV